MNDELVLVLNCGSSSIKFALIEPHLEKNVLTGLVQKIGIPGTEMQWKYKNSKEKTSLDGVDYRVALQKVITDILQKDNLHAKIVAVGHRVVHGGEKFTTSVLVNDEVLKSIRECSSLAPLHNPANIVGIEESQKAFPDLPNTVVFDTAFHQTMPPHAYIYPIPYEYYTDHKVRRYGFHGTSHNFVADEAIKRLNISVEDSALITAHLGNGCSVAAILNGKSVDTSMGFTPLEGLMMGTRSGDVDPSLHAYLANVLKCDHDEIVDILNKKSGFLGVSGISSDSRSIEEAMQGGNKQAKLAFEVFCYRLAKYISSLVTPLGRLDALVFTGGIGENSPLTRARTLEWLKIYHFEIDEKLNSENGKNSNGFITTKKSACQALVVPTNEELAIAREALRLCKKKK